MAYRRCALRIDVHGAELGPGALEVFLEISVGLGSARSPVNVVVQQELEMDGEVNTEGQDLSQVPHFSKDACEGADLMDGAGFPSGCIEEGEEGGLVVVGVTDGHGPGIDQEAQGFVHVAEPFFEFFHTDRGFHEEGVTNEDRCGDG